MNASGCARPGEDVGRLKASCVDVMALRLVVRVFLEPKRFASQLMMEEGYQESRPGQRSGRVM